MTRYSFLLFLVLFFSGCALKPDPVPPAPYALAQAVVFDIDGTLTPDVMSIYTARPEAAKAVQLYADKGFTVIYLSARIKLFQSNIPGWLQKNNFPEGPIHVTETRAEAKDPAAFKARILKAYQNQDWVLAYAYGDSSTDFEAYSAVGIPKEHIFALQRKGETLCQPGNWADCLTNWGEQLDFIQNIAPSTPPNNEIKHGELNQ
jgi:phosphatidate phosphatase PAH1